MLVICVGLCFFYIVTPFVSPSEATPIGGSSATDTDRLSRGSADSSSEVFTHGRSMEDTTDNHSGTGTASLKLRLTASPSLQHGVCDLQAASPIKAMAPRMSCIESWRSRPTQLFVPLKTEPMLKHSVTVGGGTTHYYLCMDMSYVLYAKTCNQGSTLLDRWTALLQQQQNPPLLPICPHLCRAL